MGRFRAIGCQVMAYIKVIGPLGRSARTASTWCSKSSAMIPSKHALGSLRSHVKAKLDMFTKGAFHNLLWPSCGTVITTLPQLSLRPNMPSASGTLANPTKSLSVYAVPLNFPSCMSLNKPLQICSVTCGSSTKNLPQWRPTKLTFFSKTLFIATFSMSPAAKPMIKILPFHLDVLSAFNL